MKTPVTNAPFSYITDDSQECDSQTAFLLTQLNARYLENAKENGCASVISPKDLHDYLQTDIKIIGVCGTNGKTTTAAAIYSTLLDLGYGCAFQGTRGFFINDQKVEGKTLTTPTLFHVYLHLDQAIKAGCEYFVTEVSSHAIAQQRIEGLEFVLKVHTNLTSDHLDFHGTVENYHAVKNSFFSDFTPKVINQDDPNVRYEIKNTVTYGIENMATYKVNAYTLNEGVDASVQFANEPHWIHSPLFGLHNLYNLTAAFAAVHLLTQKPLDEVTEALEQFGGVAGRMERLSETPLVVNDFAHTEDGMKQAFESFSMKPIVVIFGAGGDRDQSKRPLMGKVAERYAQKIIVTSDNPRSEDPAFIASQIMDGIKNKAKVEVILDRTEAIKKALEIAEPDDVILILGKGDEDYMEIKGEKIPYSDKETVLSLLDS